MTDYFSGSESDISYGLVGSNPILYQDDSARFSSSIEGAQKDNILMSTAMKSMQLELIVDKSVKILFGKTKQVNKIKKFH